MTRQKKDYMLATPEMVDEFIEEYYADGFHDMEVLLKNIAVLRKPEVDTEKIVADTIAKREQLVEKVSVYEDELVKMLDLATVLLEHRSLNDDDSMDGYINYLLEKNIVILPDIIEIIQLLKKN